MSNYLNMISKLEERKRRAKKSTGRFQLFTAEYIGLTREGKNQLEKNYNAIEKSKRGTERIRLFTPGDGLAREQKKRLEKYYNDKGVKVSLGRQLKVIRVYDQGYMLPYKCTVNNKDKAVIIFASVYQNGDLIIKQSSACSETRYYELIEKDADTIQNTAVKAFPTAYKVP